MASEPVLVIETAPEIELSLTGLGPVRVRDGGLFFRRMHAWRRRPLSTNCRAFANEAMAFSLEPKPSASAIDRLPEQQRRSLMLAVVRAHGEKRAWRRLAGSFLRPDERLFAVLLWAADREQAQRERVAALLREKTQGRLREVGIPADLARRYAGSGVSHGLASVVGLRNHWTQLTTTMEFWTQEPLSKAMRGTTVLTPGASTPSESPMRVGSSTRSARSPPPTPHFGHRG
jgi:hypothetical protein